VDKLRELGYQIPRNDHTAVADVLAVRAVYKARMKEGKWIQ
jgi:hypothetical protein